MHIHVHVHGRKANFVLPYTVDREIFAVEIFSDSMASPKIKHAKIMRTINDSAVRGRLSENYLTRKFIIRNICNAKYSRITVAGNFGGY